MKAALEQRIRRLWQQRVDVETRALAELQRLDQQLAPLERLVRQWDALSVDQALAEVTKAGLTVKVDQ